MYTIISSSCIQVMVVVGATRATRLRLSASCLTQISCSVALDYLEEEENKAESNLDEEGFDLTKTHDDSNNCSDKNVAKMQSTAAPSPSSNSSSSSTQPKRGKGKKKKGKGKRK